MKIVGQKKHLWRFALLILILLGLGVAGYFRYASPTRVAFVNYPEYILAPMLDQELPPAVKVSHLPWTEKSGEELKNYDCVIFFGMGLNFTEPQQKILSELKIPVYTTASTRRETALAVMTDAQRETLAAYLAQGGKKNFRRMLDYIRYELDGKRLWAPRPEPPEKAELKTYFHIEDDHAFRTIGEFQQWYRETGRFKENVPTVCILSGNGGGDLGKLIAALEGKGLNVVAANGMWAIMPDLDKIKPDLIIYQPHGRLGDRAVAYLKKHNIPLFCPIKVNQPYDEYLKDQRGMTGGMLSQSITMPELDGGVVPFVLSALVRNERGLLEFRVIPDRLERFAELIRKTTALKKIPNKDKKIALIYYGSIGKESATAGLGISQSVLNLLKKLQSEGYTTGPLPASVEELDREIQANTAIFGKLGGERQAKSAHIHTVTITPEEYASWIKKSMPDDLYAEVVKRYGEFPGRLFRNEDGNMEIGCIRFGNITLMPQSLPGEGDNESKLIHGVKMAPPHTYIATYLYLRHGFQADALMHLGTHGSLEFTPWKQAALSSYDWPDVLMGEMPHYYLYIINNIGEAQIAKRRAYATMVSHLTPPFMNSEAYGAVSELREKLQHFEVAENPALKAEYGKAIIAIVKREHFDRDLKLSDRLAQGELTEEDFNRIEEYLHEISDAKVNRGVYIIGRPYSEAEAAETAQLMTADAIADAMFKADVKAGKVQEEQRKNHRFYRENYLVKAREKAREVLAHPDLAPKPAVPPAPAAPPAGMGAGVTPDTMRKMVESGKLPDGRPIPPEMMAAMQGMMNRSAAAGAGQPAGRGNGRRSGGMGGMGGGASRPEPKPDPVAEVLRSKAELLGSTEAELASILNAFAGGYLAASPGGDPILNPAVVPTGKNLYGIDPERTPTRESYAVGKELAEALIADKLKSTGKYPKKVGFSLWGGEFIRTQGTNIGEIFYLLGVEPIWDSRGRVQDVRLIPLSELKRPRIDVIVQTSGQFRGAATSRMRLIDKAVALAAADPEGEFGNYVREGSLAVTRALIASGLSPEQAKSLGNSRIFGGVNGNFGTGVTGMAQNTGSWEDTRDIAEVYLNNMGALYTEGHWGEHIPGVFKAALTDTDTVVQSRSSNSWGPLSLDHVYEFTGGLALAARHVTGSDPGAYFNDLRTPGRARIQEAGEAAMVEARSTMLNPKYIKEMMKEGAASAGHFREVFHNTLGWEIMKPDMLEDHLWQEYKEVYLDDKLKLDIRRYFEENSPAALHDMTGVMLEAIRKDFWKADAETARQIAEAHVELMKKFDLPPLPNEKLQEMIRGTVQNPELREAFERQVAKALELRRAREDRMKKMDEKVSGMKLKAQQPEPSPEGDTRTALRIIALIVLASLLSIVLGNFFRKRKKTGKTRKI